MNHEHSQKRQNCEIKWFGEPKGHTIGEAQGFLRFCLNIGELEGIGAFSLEKLVNHLL